MVDAKGSFHGLNARSESRCRSHTDSYNVYQLIQVGEDGGILAVKTVIEALVVIYLMLLRVLQRVPLIESADKLSQNAGEERPYAELHEVLSQLVAGSKASAELSGKPHECHADCHRHFVFANHTFSLVFFFCRGRPAAVWGFPLPRRAASLYDSTPIGS